MFHEIVSLAAVFQSTSPTGKAHVCSWLSKVEQGMQKMFSKHLVGFRS